MEIVRVDLFNDAIRSVMALDKSVLGVVHDRGWYTDRYGDGKSVVYFVHDHDQTPAYLILSGISAELFDALSAGVILGNSDISPLMYRKVPARFNFISSIVISKEYRSIELEKRLLGKCTQDLNRMPVIMFADADTIPILSSLDIKYKPIGYKRNIAVRYGTELSRESGFYNNKTLWEVCETAGATLFYQFADSEHGHCIEDVLNKIKEDPFTDGIEGNPAQYSLQERNLIGMWREACRKKQEGQHE